MQRRVIGDVLHNWFLSLSSRDVVPSSLRIYRQQMSSEWLQGCNETDVVRIFQCRSGRFAMLQKGGSFALRLFGSSHNASSCRTVTTNRRLEFIEGGRGAAQ